MLLIYFGQGLVGKVNSRFDVYLSRATGLVQIGLFVITLLTLYFTVIPLYKSAQMEEVLARKEIELNSLNAKISDLYFVVRKAEIGDVVEQAVSCTGWRELALGEAKVGESLNKNVSGCIDSVVSGYDMSRIKNVDRLLFKDRVSAIKLLVESRRAKYKGLYDGYAEKISIDPASAIPMRNGELADKLEVLMVEVGVEIPRDPKEELAAKVRAGRAEIENQYLKASTSLIRDMAKVDWAD